MASELEVELDEWRDGQIAYIRDYRYVTADAELTLAPKAKPARDGAAIDVSSCNDGIPSDDERRPTVRNLDFILDVLRDLSLMTGVILESQAARARMSSISLPAPS